MKLEYLYLPEVIKDLLEEYPFLKENLSDPANEGVKSEAFSNVRKSKRQIYRILTNQHYPHLQELLKMLNSSLSYGYKNPAILRTRGQSEFSSAVSEVYIAQHYAASEYKVIGLDLDKNSEKTGDIKLEKEKKNFIAEIYAPRINYGLEIFLDELRLSLKYLDIPRDYIFDIDMKKTKNFNSEGRLLYFDQDGFSQFMDSGKVRNEFLDNIAEDLLKMFQEREENSFQYQMNIDHLNVTITIKVTGIINSKGDFPIRRGVCSPPTMTDYTPESKFESLLTNKITNKLSKNQIQSQEDISKTLLIVDISRMSMSIDFESEHYFNQFTNISKKFSEDNEITVDCIIIGNTVADAKNPFIVYYVITKDKLEENEVIHLTNTNLIQESDQLWKLRLF